MQQRWRVGWILLVVAIGVLPCQGDAGISQPPVASGGDVQSSALEAIEQARKLSEKGKLLEALHFYQQALQWFQGDAMRSEQADTISEMAVVYRKLGEVERSLLLQQQAIEVYDDLDDLSGKAKALRRIGVLRRHTGDFEAAIAAQEEALNLLTQIEDQAGIAMVLTNLGTIYGDLGRLAEARTYFDRALHIYTTLNNQQGVSYIYGNLGQLALYLGDSRQALHYLEQSLSLKRTLDDRRGQANTLLNIGTVYRNTGNFQHAFTFYYQALEHYRDLSDTTGTAMTLGHIGATYEELGDLDKALQFQLQAFDLKKANGGSVQVTVALTDLASLAIKQGRFEEAARYLEEGLTLAETQDSLFAQAHIYGQRGNLYLQQNALDEALADLTTALHLYSRAGSQKGQLEIYQYVGHVYMRQHQVDQALQYYVRGAELAENLNDGHSLWKIQYYLGEAALQQGEPESALTHFIASVDTLEHMRSYLHIPELRQIFDQKDLNPYVQVIRLLLKQHQVKEALVYVERLKARTFLEVVAHGEPQLHTTPGILQEEQYVAARIRYLQQKLAQTAENSNLPLAASEEMIEEDLVFSKHIARELAEAKARYEELLLQIKLQYPEYYRLRSVDADEIRQLVEQALTLVEPDVMVLEYFLDAEAVHIWSIEQAHIAHVRVPVPRDEVVRTVLTLRDEVGYYFSDRVYPLLHTLYTWLLAPVESQMEAKTIIGVVPFEVLHFVPFGALLSTPWTGSEATTENLFPSYLIENYALFSLPSFSMLPIVRQQSQRNIEVLQQRKAQQYMLGFGNATHNLPGAEQEIVNVTQRFEGSKAYMGQEATKQRFFDEAGRYEIIHLATHGVYDKQHPLFSYLEFASEALYAREIFGLQLGASLVTLSGCETLLPQQVEADDVDGLVSGNELIGFVRAFLYAGTSSVLSSLWRVNDAATQYLMETFYQQLPAAGKANSLQKASQAVIRQTIEVGRRKPRQISLQHPFFWSSFVLIGDWK